MKSFIIKLNTLEEIKRFCSVVQRKHYYGVDIDVSIGRYVVDAKSTIGIFTLDLSKPVTVTIHTDDDLMIDRLLMQCKDWIEE